ncbi:MAG: hypothetical protein FWD78_14535 [Treponema sp.]|nr:hypothetical protein [Treponema sp.]
MKPRTPYTVFTAIFAALCCLFASCSSVPKKPVEIFTERIMAANQLDLANNTANQGRFADALLIINDSKRRAISVDDPSLIIKTAIYRGNILFSLGRSEEAFADWEAAQAEADRSGLKDLWALAGIYAARGNLLQLINSGSKNSIPEIRDQVSVLIALIKSDNIAQAMGYLVQGMCEKEMQRYADAEKSVRHAIDIHEKNRYLEEAAYDWYFLASIFSVSQRYDDALSALGNSISFDRRAENGFGLASSWQAMGEVYLKNNRREDSAASFNRASEIFLSIGLDDLAAVCSDKAAAAR